MKSRGNNDQPPAYNVGAPPQAAYYQPPPRKTKRRVALWVPFATGIGGLVLGAAVGGAGKNDTTTSGPAVGAATTVVTASAVGPAGNAPATSKPAPPANTGAMADVTLGKFTVDSIGVVHVPVTIVNHSSKTSNYLAEFEVDNAAGVKIGDGFASTDNLAPGQKAQLEGMATASQDGATAVKLTQVTRYAS